MNTTARENAARHRLQLFAFLSCVAWLSLNARTFASIIRVRATVSGRDARSWSAASGCGASLNFRGRMD
jgi:hypothetical protein